MSKPDGGHAFPRLATLRARQSPAHTRTDYVPEYVGGMTLRDYFAGQALVALFSEAGHPQHEGWNAVGAPEISAKIAYRLADAMIAAREDER